MKHKLNKDILYGDFKITSKDNPGDMFEIKEIANENNKLLFETTDIKDLIILLMSASEELKED